MGGTPVGISDVVRMNFELKIGKWDSGSTELLCDQDSFKQGISLSDLKWGFTSPAVNSGDYDASRISFTLHDIAGKMIDTVMKLRTGAYFIYFKGPKSDGSLWNGKEVVYVPVSEECKIEFSPTQGFTYTFSGNPLIQFAKSPILSTKQDLTITGTIVGPNQTYKNYVEKELVEIWNQHVIEDQKKPTAKISISVEGSPAINNQPYITKKNNKGMIEDFKIPAGTTIADAVRLLFYNRFYPSDDAIHQGKKGTTNHRPTISVMFKKWKGAKVDIVVKVFDEKDEKSITTLDVCIGDDGHCQGSKYRAQLAGMNFDGLYSLLTASAVLKDLESGEKKTSAMSGNEDVMIQQSTQTDAADNYQQKDVQTPMAGSFTKIGIGSWGMFDTLLHKYKMPNFTIDIDMPYTYDFTPKTHGGVLEDAIQGASSSGISMSQGVNLKYYWYTDPNCESLALQPGISNKYRISKIVHQIGLSGNSTQVTLSHLTL
jgi:hypothetical protein